MIITYRVGRLLNIYNTRTHLNVLTILCILPIDWMASPPHFALWNLLVNANSTVSWSNHQRQDQSAAAPFGNGGGGVEKHQLTQVERKQDKDQVVQWDGETQCISVWIQKRRVESVSHSPSYTGSKVLTGHSCTHLGSWRTLLQLPRFLRHISPSYGCRTSARGFGLTPRESVTGPEISHLIKVKQSENEVQSNRFKHGCCWFGEQIWLALIFLHPDEAVRKKVRLFYTYWSTSKSINNLL